MSHSRYDRLRELGVGGFGVVDASLDVTTGNQVAVKSIMASKVHAEAKRLVRELDIMIRLKDRHPNIMTICDAYLTYPDSADQMNFNVHIVMPLMRGDLHRFTREFPRLPVPNRAEFGARVSVVFAFHVAYGLDYLHKSNIVHRDLKPDNILVNVDTTDPFGSLAVIADFGLARASSPTETFYICTRQYRPPEVITNTAQGDSSLDIWSLGCVYFELVTGRTLFHLPSSLENGQWVGAKASYQLEEILSVIGTPDPAEVANMDASNVKSYLQKTRQRRSKLREKFDTSFRLSCDDEERELWFDLIGQCLSFFPRKRPTGEQVCSHKLFRRYNILFGENVHQLPPIDYRGGATSELRHTNKMTIKNLIMNTDFGQQIDERLTVRFPEVHNPEIRARFEAMPTREVPDIQRAIDVCMQGLQDPGVVADHDDLRTLLSYYVRQLPIPPTGEDDTVQIAPPVQSDDVS
jgi:serine/threonine protein kinase